MTILDIMQKAVSMGASDVFLVAGLPVTFKCDGHQERLPDNIMKPPEIQEIVENIYELAHRNRGNLDRGIDDDFSFAVWNLGRFRVNVFRQRGSLAAVIRVIHFGLPDPVKLGIPESVLSLADTKKGLVLITGSAGTGKSTTLACMIDRINTERHGHIVTIEDPIEYIHNHKQSLVSQRDVPNDVPTFARALRAALRQAPDAVLVDSTDLSFEETVEVILAIVEERRHA